MKFRGSSDDLIYVAKDGSDWVEYHPSSSASGDLKSVFAVGPFYVFVYYDGIWHFSVRLQREGDEIPEDVSIRTEQAHEYSMQLVIESDERNFHETPVDLDQVSF